MGIKFPDESFVLHNILKSFTPIGSGKSYPFFPPSIAVAHQIDSASGQNKFIHYEEGSSKFLRISEHLTTTYMVQKPRGRSSIELQFFYVI
jgi:hypothetical protein